MLPMHKIVLLLNPEHNEEPRQVFWQPKVPPHTQTGKLSIEGCSRRLHRAESYELIAHFMKESCCSSSCHEKRQTLAQTYINYTGCNPSSLKIFDMSAACFTSLTLFPVTPSHRSSSPHLSIYSSSCMVCLQTEHHQASTSSS